MKLTIVPLASVAANLPREIARRLRTVLPWKLVVSSPLSNPQPDGPATTLDAQQVLSLLPSTGRHDELTVGLSGFDLSAAGLDYVFGYAAPERRAAVVSLARLMEGTSGRRGGRRLLVERSAKEVLHETGHLMGLEHCDHPQCVMHYSQVLQDTDIKGCGYCARCLKELSRLPEAPGER